MAPATLLLTVAVLYGAVGLLPAAAFVLVGAGRIDPGARKGSAAFRLLILPGALLLWPLVTWKWIAAAGAARGAGKDRVQS